MKPEEIDYCRYRIERARETLGAAKILLDAGHLHAAVNRLYYACFYVVSALLLTQKLYSSKHGGIRALFFRHWVNQGKVPVEMGHFYQTIFEWRQEGDYADLVRFKPEEVEKWFHEAESFVLTISKQAEERLA